MVKKIGFIASALALMASPAIAQPEQFPPLIKIIVPFSAGGTTDVMARGVASDLAKRLGTTVVVENMAGASTFIGAAAVAKGPKDGSMILLTSASTFTAAATKRAVSIDVLSDLQPVALLCENPIAVGASQQSGIKTPADLIAAARARPGIISHGSGGVGTIQHIAAEMFSEAAKIQLAHVPYRGASLAINDFVGGRVDLVFSSYSTFAPQVKAGRANLVGITSAASSAAFPNVPTMASVAPGFSIDVWVGFFVAPGTPAPLVQRLNRELNDIATTKVLRDVFEVDGGAAHALSPQEFGARVRSSYTAWKALATANNIVVD